MKFSDLTLQLCNTGTFIRLDSLLHFNTEILQVPAKNPQERKSAEMLLSVLNNIPKIDTDQYYESHLTIKLMSKVIRHLSKSSAVELRHKTFIKSLEDEDGDHLGLETQALGIGCKELG